MKKILFLMAALLLAGQASADELIIDDIVVPKGGTVEFPVKYSLAGGRVGFAFALDLPSGLSLETDESGDVVYYPSENISKINVQIAEGSKFGGLPSSGTATINGSDGVLLTLVLKDDGSREVGDVYEVGVSKCAFAERTVDGVKDIFLDDFTFKVTIGEPDDGRIHFDETSSNLPRYTAGEKGDVTMKRTIKKDVWNTIVLPFTLTKAKAEAAFGTDVQLSEFSGFEVEYADEDDVSPDAIVINFTSYTMTAKKGITGGKPFLIKTSKDVTEFEADDVTLTDVATSVEKADEYDTAGKFTGSLVKTVVPADGLFISDNKFWYSTGKTNIKAFRGWFELGAVLGKDTDFGAKVRFVIDDAPTSIEGIENGNVDGDVYTLQGIYVGRDVDKSRLPKGIYIIDGKKTFVK